MKKLLLIISTIFLAAFTAFSQETDTIPAPIFPIDSVSVQAYHPDSSLRIINLNPFFTLHVDSTLTYQLQINKNPDQYFWYLKNSPVGLRINKDNGNLTFNANRSLFLSGKLKYDINYKVNIGVQNLNDPQEKVDTSFNIIFYNTEIIASKVKPTVQGNIWVDEGETVSFRVLCETGSFPIDHILTLTSTPIAKYNDVQKCGDEFSWTPGYDLVKDSDSGKVKIIQLYFIGSNRFYAKDTATVRLIVREALNYPIAREDHQQVVKNIERYVTQLKFTFLQLDKKLKKTKNIRTTFDLTSASTSLTGTVLATSSSSESQRTGKILPSVGLALVPIKEASAPNRMVDQNQASLIRASIKRMEYILRDNQLLGEKDPDIVRKTNKLKEELKQVQMQLIDVPIEITNEFTEEELTRYFNSPKVNKKYRLKKM
jgi:hypothetical protein